MDQTVINWIIAACGALSGWIFKLMWQAMRDLQTADTNLASKVQAIEVLVAGEYVKRDDLEKFSTALFAKLDRIEQKVDGKADK